VKAKDKDKEKEREKLWAAYSQKRTQEVREQLILEYAELVKVIAGQLSMRFNSFVEFDDLNSFGIFGLIDAIDKYDVNSGNKFETYASKRIYGSIMDEIRKMDWIPRTVRTRQKDISEATKNVELRTGRVATDNEVAEELGVSSDEYYKWQSQVELTNTVSWNEFVEMGTEPVLDSSVNHRFILPEESVSKEELAKVLGEALQVLTEKEKKVVLMYYYEDLTLKEIAAVLDVSESRVSQLHTKGIAKMRKIMGPYMDIMTA